MTFDTDIRYASLSWPNVNNVWRSRLQDEKCSFSAIDVRYEVTYTFWIAGEQRQAFTQRLRNLLVVCRVKCTKVVGATSSEGFLVEVCCRQPSRCALNSTAELDELNSSFDCFLDTEMRDCCPSRNYPEQLKLCTYMTVNCRLTYGQLQSVCYYMFYGHITDACTNVQRLHHVNSILYITVLCW